MAPCGRKKRTGVLPAEADRRRSPAAGTPPPGAAGRSMCMLRSRNFSYSVSPSMGPQVSRRACGSSAVRICESVTVVPGLTRTRSARIVWLGSIIWSSVARSAPYALRTYTRECGPKLDTASTRSNPSVTPHM